MLASLRRSCVACLQPHATAVRSRVAFALLLGVLFFLVNVPDLTSYPLIADDEVLLNEPARVLALHGSFESPMLSGDHSPGHVLVQPPVQALAVNIVYRVSGFGFWQTRVAGLLWGAAAIALVTFVASGSDDDRLRGSIAALLVALMPLFVLGARMGRMDALCLAFALAAFAALDRGFREDRWAVATFVAGLLTALACLTHFVAFGFLGAMLLLQILGPAPRWNRLALFCLGGACIAGPWTLFLWSQGSNYLLTLLHHGTMRSATGPLAERLLGEARRWMTDGRSHFALVPVYIGGAVWAIRSRGNPATGTVRRALGVASVLLLFNAVAMSKVSGHYPVYPAVFLVLVASAWVADALRSTSRRRILAGGLFVTSVAALAGLAFAPRIVSASVQRHAREYELVEQALRALVPACSRVWTVPEAWYALAGEGRSVRTPSLEFNPVPNASVDDFAVLKTESARSLPGFDEVARVGVPLPLVFGRRFSSTDYQLTVYRAVRLGLPRGASGSVACVAGGKPTADGTSRGNRCPCFGERQSAGTGEDREVFVAQAKGQGHACRRAHLAKPGERLGTETVSDRSHASQ